METIDRFRILARIRSIHRRRSVDFLWRWPPFRRWNRFCTAAEKNSDL